MASVLVLRVTLHVVHNTFLCLRREFQPNLVVDALGHSDWVPGQVLVTAQEQGALVDRKLVQRSEGSHSAGTERGHEAQHSLSEFVINGTCKNNGECDCCES